MGCEVDQEYAPRLGLPGDGDFLLNMCLGLGAGLLAIRELEETGVSPAGFGVGRVTGRQFGEGFVLVVEEIAIEEGVLGGLLGFAFPIGFVKSGQGGKDGRKGTLAFTAGKAVHRLGKGHRRRGFLVGGLMEKGNGIGRDVLDCGKLGDCGFGQTIVVQGKLDDAVEGIVVLDTVAVHFLDEGGGFRRWGFLEGGLERGEDFCGFFPGCELVVRAAGIRAGTPRIAGPIGLFLVEAAKYGEDGGPGFGGGRVEALDEGVDDFLGVHPHKGKGGTFALGVGAAAGIKDFEAGLGGTQTGKGAVGGVGNDRIRMAQAMGDRLGGLLVILPGCGN